MPAKRKFLLCLVIILGIYKSAFAVWPVETILTSSDPESGDKFGQSVSIDGNVCVVGAYGVGSDKGAAEIYRFDEANWLHEQKISASDGTTGDKFGYSVGIDGSVCAVGAYGAGAAYIFRYNGSSWIQEQKLVPSDEARVFGKAIAIEGNICMVGSPTALVGAVTKGAVYVFEYSGGIWTQQQKLFASDGEYEDQFGEAVSIDGNFSVIGMPNDDVNATNCGSAYIFEYNGGNWIQQQKLIPTGPRDDWEQFGCSVSINSNLCVIGAKGDSGAAGSAGAAYMYWKSGVTWVLAGIKEVAPDADEGDAFGCSVSVSDDMCVIGSYLDEDLGRASGSVYLYQIEFGWGPDLRLVNKLNASDGESRDYFGKSVAIDAEYAVAGAPANYAEPPIGSAYIYDLTCPSADLNDDCYVDFTDFATMAEQWLDGIKPLDIIP